MAVKKKEGDVELPASAYAYTPDKQQVSTWKLRVDDKIHVAAAVAALGKGFRGNKVEIPEADLPAVKKKVASAYRKFFPDNEVPTILKALNIKINDQEITDEGLFGRIAGSIAEYFRYLEWEKDWVKEAEEEAEEALAENGLITKSLNEELRQGTFVVLEPNCTDLHGDIYSEDEVRKACHNFNQFCEKAYLEHAVETEQAQFVESYIAPADMSINGMNVVKGTWLAVVQFDEELWEVVKSDEKIGLSIGAYAKTEDLDD